MNNLLEKKLSRFSDVISLSGNPETIEFWNEIIDELSNPIEESDNDLKEFQIYLLHEKLAKIQTYISLRSRYESEFADKYNVKEAFEKTPQYYDYMQKALNYDFKDKPTIKRKVRTREERKIRLAAFRERIGFGSIEFLEDVL